ncbi:MAG: iron-containing alcohol dehydrogenase [Ruminococcaceae bacterium]|nr:iron-containing alcohol dehydrogenase [Oscillospiraceae bacterium]
MDFNIYMPARIISGENCVIKNSAELRKLGGKCLIVTSKTSAKKSGALDDVVSALNNENIEYTVFDEITENPLVSTVIKAGEKAREFGADFIIGIGGGSPLDASKAVAICAENPDYDIKGLYSRPVPSKALPVILVGTTSGTGSEVTGVSVLTNDEDGMKKSISGADCYSAVSFLDPKYTCSMNYDVTVSTALDAFAHAVEGWFSPLCSDLPTQYAKMALPLIYNGLKYLEETKQLPDEKLRADLYYGSIYAGLELNVCGAAFPHTVGYVLTENFGIPHGKACTAFMPYLLKKAKQYKNARYCELLEILGDSEDNIIGIINRLTDVKNLTMTEEQIKEWCSRWVNGNKNFDKTPGGFTMAEAEKVLRMLSAE